MTRPPDVETCCEYTE